MNLDEINHSGKHIQKNCKCMYCNSKYKLKGIQVIATTKTEGLFEAHCHNCAASTLINVLVAPEVEIREQNASRTHKGISENEVLDMKNFLTEFDGDFSEFIKL